LLITKNVNAGPMRLVSQRRHDLRVILLTSSWLVECTLSTYFIT